MHKEQCIGPVPGGFQCVSVADRWAESEGQAGVIQAWVSGAIFWTNSPPPLSAMTEQDQTRTLQGDVGTQSAAILSVAFVLFYCFKSLFC